MANARRIDLRLGTQIPVILILSTPLLPTPVKHLHKKSEQTDCQAGRVFKVTAPKMLGSRFHPFPHVPDGIAPSLMAQGRTSQQMATGVKGMATKGNPPSGNQKG